MILTELVPGAIVASAVAPALLLLWFVVAADSRPEPPRLVWTAVILGALSVIPVGLLEVWLLHIPLIRNPWLAVDVSTLLFVGIPEETVKISLIAVIALRARDFDEPMDGVVYGTAVGLGFAAVENLAYLMGAGPNWEITAIIRGVLSVPCHASYGAIAGAYIARARFGGALGAHSRWRRPRLLLSAWLIPVVLHTVFDASLLSLPNADTNTTKGAVEASLLVLTTLVVGFGTIGLPCCWRAGLPAGRRNGCKQSACRPPTGVPSGPVLDRCRLELRGVNAAALRAMRALISPAGSCWSSLSAFHGNAEDI